MILWETLIRAQDPVSEVLKTWCGPKVAAPSAALAQEWCDMNGLGYCRVTGLQVIAEIPCKPGTLEPDWSNMTNHDQSDN